MFGAAPHRNFNQRAKLSLVSDVVDFAKPIRFWGHGMTSTLWVVLAGWICLNAIFVAIRIYVTARRDNSGWVRKIELIQ